MSGYEALCHSFTTLSTGGFSTRSASIGAFESRRSSGSSSSSWRSAASTSCSTTWRSRAHRRRPARHRAALLPDRPGLRNAALVAWALWSAGGRRRRRPFLRTSMFQVVALTTTTGYTTANFEFWPGLAMLVLLQVMILGGMAGSTSGGVKSLRT